MGLFSALVSSGRSSSPTRSTTTSSPVIYDETMLLGSRRDPVFAFLTAVNTAINYHARTMMFSKAMYADGDRRQNASHGEIPLFTAVLYEGSPELEARLDNGPVELDLVRGGGMFQERLREGSQSLGGFIAYPASQGELYLSRSKHTVPGELRLSAVDAARSVASRLVPADFVKRDDHELPLADLDDAVLHAMGIPLVLGQGRTYCIIGSVYGDAGVGKVAVFDRHGLAAETILTTVTDLRKTVPELRGRVEPVHYVDPDRDGGIVGVLRTYPTPDKHHRHTYLLPARL